MRVDTIDERLGLFRQMVEHAGIDPMDPAQVLEGDLRAAAQRCLGCRVGDECRNWLAEVEDNAPPAGFCRNAETFENWVAAAVATSEQAWRELGEQQPPL